ncbi:NAD(P)-binding protein [Clostridiaceae bacterium 35-E11]
MNIAIMGAGLSGLACAIILEQNGIYPTIFENRTQVGDRFINGEILLSILHRPVFDCIAYFSEKFNIDLQPISNITELAIHSEKEKCLINGHLGFTNLRGRHEHSFENQLARQVKSKIIFQSKYTYEQLLREFTHVVVATGDAAYAMNIQDYQQDFTVTLKGATVEGDFQPHKVMAWLNNKLAPKGYGYLIPYSKKEANIVIGYPDYPENRMLNINELWKKFHQQVCENLQQDLKITDGFQVTRYIIGKCQYPRIGNTFFVGNCFGSIMPFLGFGQFIAILTGIYAAHDLCGIGDYNKLTKTLHKTYRNSLVFRRSMEKLENNHFDTLVRNLDGYLGNKLFNSKHYDPLKIASYLLRPWIRINSK